MLTRCPSCATAFRITRAQLQARHGMVRCGRCGNAFNAVDHAVEAAAADVPAPPAIEPANLSALTAPAPAGSMESTGAAEWVPADTLEETGQRTPRTIASRFVASSTVERAMSAEAPAAAGPAEAAVSEPPAEVSPAPEEVIPVAPPAVEEAGPRDEEATGPTEDRPIAAMLAGEAAAPARRRLPRTWGLAVLAMLLLAGAQFTYIFRDELASGMPWTKPYLGAFCDLLGCRIELLRLPELMDIEYSDLQPESGRRDRLMLRATVRNRASVTLAYPHLELTLTDHRDQALARRVLPPAEYLPPGTDAATGVAANGEIHVALPLDVAGVGASGYRLYVFYP
jgi:predicted Zn finger-like uncharacterized protein